MNTDKLALIFSDSDLYSVQHKVHADVFEIVFLFLSSLKKRWNLSTRTTCRFFFSWLNLASVLTNILLSN